MGFLFKDIEGLARRCGWKEKWNAVLGKTMNFGKYKGLKYSYIIQKDKLYCSWLCENIKQPRGVLSDFIYYYKQYSDAKIIDDEILIYKINKISKNRLKIELMYDRIEDMNNEINTILKRFIQLN